MSTTYQLRAAALADIDDERCRQEELVEQGRFAWTCADPSIDDGAKLAVLVEELGEVGRELCEGAGPGREVDRAKLRAELVQTAAVACAWIEAIDETDPEARP